MIRDYQFDGHFKQTVFGLPLIVSCEILTVICKATSALDVVEQ